VGAGRALAAVLRVLSLPLNIASSERTLDAGSIGCYNNGLRAKTNYGKKGRDAMRGFILGVFLTLLILIGGGYWFIRSGKLSMATTAKPLPFEQAIASAAIEGSIANGKDVPNPLPLNDDNMVAGVKEYKGHCIFCHGAPGPPHPEISTMMFPRPPQLFEKDDMVIDDPSGSIFWVITNGIRLSGMPGFDHHLSDTERWQLTMLLSHADKLPAAVKAEFARKDVGEMMMHANHEHEHEQ
jgi:thiosulfate dehydrogenase